MDLLKYYNNLDVRPFLEAVINHPKAAVEPGLGEDDYHRGARAVMGPSFYACLTEEPISDYTAALHVVCARAARRLPRRSASFRKEVYSWQTCWQLQKTYGDSEAAKAFVAKLIASAERRANPADPDNRDADLFKVCAAVTEGACASVEHSHARIKHIAALHARMSCMRMLAQ